MLKMTLLQKNNLKSKVLLTAIIISVAVIGSVLLIASKAAQPFASINADKGTISSPAKINADSTASDGKNVTFGSASITPPPPPPAVVSKTPDAPFTPSGGWSVAYANAFGSCLAAFTGATCSSGAPQLDNTLLVSNGHPSNSNEPTWYVPSQNVVDQNGLELNCTYSPGVAVGKNYACGEVTTRSQSANGTGDPAGYKLFHFSPGHGETWAFQATFKAPFSTGESDPGWWATGFGWSWEIDFPEMWGWNSGSGGKNWCPGGDRMGFPAIPHASPGGPGGQGVLSFCSGTANFSPDAAYHTYTLIMNSTTFSSYIDGNPVTWSSGAGAGKTSFSVGNTSSWSPDMGGLLMQHSMRDPTVGNPDPYFKSGTRTLAVRSMAIYENTTANFSHTVNGGTIAPGTIIK